MELQKIVWKVAFNQKSNPNPDHFFKLFNTWIPNSPEVFVDVIDYKHISGGPITLLAGCYADFVYEEYDQQKGLTYSYKKFMTGDNQAKLKKTLDPLFLGTKKLKKDPLFSKIDFDRSKLNLLINDRALCPNTTENQKELQKELEVFFNTLDWDAIKYDFNTNPAERLQVKIEFKHQSC